MRAFLRNPFNRAIVCAVGLALLLVVLTAVFVNGPSGGSYRCVNNGKTSMCQRVGP